MPKFFAHGKLMLTAEYAVLRGASALAVPTIFGQHLFVENQENGLHWESIDYKGNVWFNAIFSNDLHVIESSDSEKAGFLANLLINAVQLSSSFNYKNKKALTTLNFPNNWGLGSSSTLVSLVAQWAGCDALQLFFRSMQGSGYDVACAMAKTPILYKLINGQPEYTSVQLNWPFTDQIFFVHLGDKQNSAKEVARFEQQYVLQAKIEDVTSLTKSILRSDNLTLFQENITRHEQLIGEIIGLKPVKQKLFADYPHAIKSLGAWGGDFILAIGGADEMNYFRNKGYQNILPWPEVVF